LGYYDLSKGEREKVYQNIFKDLLNDFKVNSDQNVIQYFSDNDTYIRKNAYLALGRIYFANESLRLVILKKLNELLQNENSSIRQTTVNAAGEIGMMEFDVVERVFDIALFDKHHTVRNAVIGSVKKMGQKNPLPVLNWAKKYLHHPEKEIRREICHGIELRGRTHPEDILPMLKELQFDKTARVRNTLVHVLGQISYKKGCLKTVIDDLKNWENKDLVNDAILEIIDVHDRYKNFTVLTQEQAIKFIEENFSRP